MKCSLQTKSVANSNHSYFINYYKLNCFKRRQMLHRRVTRFFFALLRPTVFSQEYPAVFNLTLQEDNCYSETFCYENFVGFNVQKPL